MEWGHSRAPPVRRQRDCQTAESLTVRQMKDDTCDDGGVQVLQCGAVAVWFGGSGPLPRGLPGQSSRPSAATTSTSLSQSMSLIPSSDSTAQVPMLALHYRAILASSFLLRPLVGWSPCDMCVHTRLQTLARASTPAHTLTFTHTHTHTQARALFRTFRG